MYKVRDELCHPTESRGERERERESGRRDGKRRGKLVWQS
jgi:hypothetical protein